MNNQSNKNLLLEYLDVAHNPSPSFIKCLLSEGYNVNDVNKYNVSILNLYINSFDNDMAKYIKLDIIKLLTPDNINHQCDAGYTVLHAVCRKVPTRIDIIKYLVEDCNINVNLRTICYKEVALFKYIRNANSLDIDLEIIKLLIPDNINIQYKNGFTALHAVCKKKLPKLDIIKYLVEDCNIDINIKDYNNSTALDYSSGDIKTYLQYIQEISKNKLKEINNKIFQNCEKLIEVHKNISKQFENIEELRNKYKELLDEKNNLINKLVEKELN